VPNVLLDRLMPELRDTELRVLLVLLRETTGWNRGGQAVSLPYRLLARRTGRHSEALVSAVASLERRGLVHLPGRYRLRFAKPGASESGTATNKDK